MGLANRLAKLEKRRSPGVAIVAFYDANLARCLDALLTAVTTAEELDGLWQRIVKEMTTDEDDAVLDTIPRDALMALDPQLFPRDAAQLVVRICELWCSITVH